MSLMDDGADFDFESEANPNLIYDMRNAATDRRGSANMPFLVERDEIKEKRHEKDKFQRHLTKGASGYLREMQQVRYQRQATRVLGELELSKDMIVDGLSGVGKHPLAGKHALLDLNLKGLKLFDCAALKDFPYVVYVDISKNAIQDISPLRNILAMTHLDASQNQIGSLTNFAPPLCSKKNSWSEGKKAVGSMLIYANLGNNNICSLEGVEDHPFVECLLLSNNSISSMDGLMALRNLQVLDLSYNNLSAISPLTGMQIQELNLRGNSISDLSGLEELLNLHSLDVCDNEISDLTPLSKCVELSYLDVGGNNITAIEDFFVLNSCVNLRKLLGLRNNAAETTSYRRQLIYHLPNLETLDVTFVSAIEKLEAYNFYKDPAGDYAMMQEVYSKYFPGETLKHPEDQECEGTLEVPGC